MFKVIHTIQVTLIGPILTQSSSPGGWGIDYVAARNSENQLYLPGTLLVGKLQQAWQELKEAVSDGHWFSPTFDKWLGEVSENALPKTKQLFFSDLIYQPDSQDKTGSYSRIKIDPDRGAVDKHQLVLIESPFLTGKDYLFTGYLHFFAANETEVEKIIRHVEAGLNWTSQLGALRSTGFGRIKHIDCSQSSKIRIPEPSVAELKSPDNVFLAIRPLYPFCITGKPIADNLFESQAIIPGGVVLGAIATTWNQLCGHSGGRLDEIIDTKRPKLKEHFSLIRINHALPNEQPYVRPITLPLSLVTVHDDKNLYDVILLDGPSLINDKAPAFAVDWKDDANTLHEYSWPHLRRKDFGWPNVTKELRTRTAINPETLCSADNELFSYEQIVPGTLSWNTHIDLSRIPEEDRKTVYLELQSLLGAGIAALGKTKTPATLEWTAAVISTNQPSTVKPLNDNQWIVTLQTDTLLGSPEKLNETSSQVELQTMYKLAWQELSGNKLELVRYFARQRLSGGTFRRNVFQKTEAYRPWLLTEAGSVFLLRSTDNTNIEACEQLIQEWLVQGLPIKGSVLKYYGIDEVIGKQWQHCPFVPQNGYGEIVVNLPLHTQLKPKNVTPIAGL